MSQRDKYRNKNPIHQFFLKRFLSRVSRTIKESGANSILDAACAEGYVIDYLHARQPGLSFFGVDIDEPALIEARAMCPYAQFTFGDITTYRNPNEVDLTMALEVLEHIENPERTLLNLARLNSNYFLFSVPHEPYFRAMNFLRGRHWRRLGNHPEHLNLWSKHSFAKALKPYFEVVSDYSSFPWILYLARKRT